MLEHSKLLHDSWLRWAAESKEDADICIMGVPFDGAVSLNAGAAQAPETLRMLSIDLSDVNEDWVPIKKGILYDIGDLPVSLQWEKYFSDVEAKAYELMKAGKFCLFLGGDHSVTIPLHKAYGKYQRDSKPDAKIGVIHFDAHLDNYDAFGDDLYSRCCPFFQLYNDPNMDPTKIVHLGIRGPRNHQGEGQNAKKYGATVIPSMEVKKNGWEAAIKKALEVATKDTEALYITICSDALDAAFMPQGPQDMGGLTSFELMMMVHECGKAGASAFDFVEIYPDAYSLHTASHVGCWMALYLLNGLAERKINNNG